MMRNFCHHFLISKKVEANVIGGRFLSLLYHISSRNLKARLSDVSFQGLYVIILFTFDLLDFASQNRKECLDKFENS